MKAFIDRHLEKWVGWRHQIHQHPETAFEEVRTSRFVAETLQSFGLEVHRGLAKTGVVGVLKSGASERSVALRADMDALDILEENDLPYASRNPGKMHACGHDGHTTMVLAAAEYLSQHRDFDGTVYFIFQPAEENLAGGKRMIDEGLFKRFPADLVFGMHNWPGIPEASFATRPGFFMASYDMFEIRVHGRSAHAATPERGMDPILVGADIVSQLYKIVGSDLGPQDSGVITVTQFHGGSTWNIIPEQASIRGSVRAFTNEVRDTLQRRIEQTAHGVAGAYGTDVAVDYRRTYCPTVNGESGTKLALGAAVATVGDEQVDPEVEPTGVAEDFGYMLEEVEGNFIWIGGGDGPFLHSSRYDFNDRIIPAGVEYWIRLAHSALKR